jgi:hypothetical protein
MLSSTRNLPISVCLGSAIMLSLVVDAAAKNTVLTQMTPSVCWQTCSAPCDQTYEKCAPDTKLNAGQLSDCRKALDACQTMCRDQCGLK